MKSLNYKEIEHFAYSSKPLDKEGFVHMVAQDAGLIRRKRLFAQYQLRLKGNILFYFKVTSKNSLTDKVLEGMHVLEGCTTQCEISSNEEYPYRVTIRPYSSEEKCIFTFYVENGEEAKSWENLLNSASYEHLRQKFSNLRNSLQEVTGDDPVEGTYFACKPMIDVAQFDKPSTASFTKSSKGDHYLEISIACSSLVSINPEVVPNPKIKVSLFDSSNNKWIKFSQTEVVENCSDPQFIATICFTEEQYKTHSYIRFEVFDVRNHKESIVSRIGQAECKISQLVNSNGLLTLNIKGADEEDNLRGFIYLQTWNSESDYSRGSVLMASRIHEFIQQNEHNINSEEDVFALSKEFQDRTQMNNIIISTYRLPLEEDNEESLQVTEIMGEAKHAWELTIGLIQTRIKDESQKLSELMEIDGLSQEWQDSLQDLVEEKKQFINHYRTCIDSLTKHETFGFSFKKSIDKKAEWMECMPTNLHVQTMKVVTRSNLNDRKKTTCAYDTITVGAPTSFNLKYRSGGLRRIFINDSPLFYHISQEARIRDIYSHLPLMLESLKKHVYEVLKMGCRKQKEEMKHAAEHLNKWFESEFFSFIYTPLLNESLKHLRAARLPQFTPSSSCSGMIISNQTETIRDLEFDPLSNAYDHKQDKRTSVLESDYSLEDMIRQINVRKIAMLDIVTEIANDDYRGRLQEEEWDLLLKPSAEELLETAQIMFSQSRKALLFSIYREVYNLSTHGYLTGLKSPQHRRDICFIQAVVSIAVSFCVTLKANIIDWSYLAQLHAIGFLCHWESLISTAGEELGMLEDFEICRVDVNQFLFFQIVSLESNSCNDTPYISGNRNRVVVHVPISASLFKLLPYPLQAGQLIKVVLIVFNIGINEQQTLADHIGDTSIQERMNQLSLADLHKYYTKYRELFIFANEKLAQKVQDCKKKLDTLHELLTIRKQKNVDILHFSSSLSRDMNASRITSCKSGKDRTGMSVTLEQCKILLQKHSLKKSSFQQALDTMRGSGTRLINTEKNVGERCYAFNKLQRILLPQEYRPPEGSFKKLQT